MSSTSHDSTRLNRLADSSSPYLLLHKTNPVDWYPWGPEALERARAEDKPIFVSVGYSTCYWCHVMERESFSDPSIAAVMNEHFVNIKVDREERPDLDEIYMTATQMMTGQGGWPNSVFLTPNLEPFFAGTYFPPEERYGRPGFRQLLTGIERAWREQRAAVDSQAESLALAMRRHLEAQTVPTAQPPSGQLALRSLAELQPRFDSTWGGFGGAPKFPTPSNLLLLLETYDEPGAADMLHATLDQMARGGIYDQIGGGFHRYATDREWKVPHFEKMLYDNGLLLEVYAEAYARRPDPELRRIVTETAAFLEREMSAPEGGFWSAIDAETDGHEGAYYVWTREELDRSLGADDAAFLAPVLGFAGPPFFEGEQYVLHLPQPLDDQARQRQQNRDELLAAMAPLRRTLLASRSTRERPLTDDKILADWNGLAIAGLAIAGHALGDRTLTERAARAAEFILDQMWTGTDDDRQLQHAWRTGRAHTPAFLSDYAFLTHGLLALHRATADERWAAAAADLVAEQQRRLGDPDGGYFVAADTPDVLFRSKDPYDGAVPSANGIAVLNLLRLARAGSVASYREAAVASLRAFGELVQRQPGAARTLSIAARRLEGTQAAAAPADAATARPSAALQSEAEGVVEASLELEPADDQGWQAFRLHLEVASSWHVNANPASLDFLIPTSVAARTAELRDLDYPAGHSIRLGFADEELAVWDGSVELAGAVRPGGDRAALVLTYQACDATRCLPPVEVDLPLEASRR